MDAAAWAALGVVGAAALGAIGGVITGRLAKRSAAHKAKLEHDVAIAPLLIERIEKIEKRHEDVTGRFELIHSELAECKREKDDCRKETGALRTQNGEQAAAITELQQLAGRLSGRPIRHRLTPSDFPAAKDSDEEPSG